MALHVYIENFQAIDQVSMDIEGFTVIAGKSNTGKSSIVRAIDGLIHNRSGDDFVRDGEDNVLVRLEDDNHEVTWKKGKDHNDYIIDGEEFVKVGHHPPDKLGEIGFRDLEVGNEKISVLVAKQFNPIFLLNPDKTKGSTAAKLISDIGSLEDLQRARKQSTKDRKSNQHDLRVKKEDRAEINEHLEDFESFEEDYRYFQEVQSLRSNLQSLESTVETLRDFQAAYLEASEHAERLAPVEEIDLSMDVHDSLRSEFDALESLREISLDYQKENQTIQRLSQVDEVQPPSKDELVHLYEELDTLKSIYDEYIVNEALLSKVKMDDLSIDKPSFKEKQHLEQLRTFQSTYRETCEDIDDLEKQKEEAEEELAKAEEELHDLLGDLDICPVCQQKIS